MDFDIVQSRVLFAVGNALDADVVPGAKRQTRNSPARRRISSRLCCRQTIVGNPLVNDSIPNEHAKVRFAIVLIKVLDVYLVPARGASEPVCRRTLLFGRQTFDGLPA